MKPSSSERSLRLLPRAPRGGPPCGKPATPEMACSSFRRPGAREKDSEMITPETTSEKIRARLRNEGVVREMAPVLFIMSQSHIRVGRSVIEDIVRHQVQRRRWTTTRHPASQSAGKTHLCQRTGRRKPRSLARRGHGGMVRLRGLFQAQISRSRRNKPPESKRSKSKRLSKMPALLPVLGRAQEEDTMVKLLLTAIVFGVRL